MDTNINKTINSKTDHYRQWRELLNTIQEFTSTSYLDKGLNKIYQEGINVFIKFPKATHSALYILNESDFNFEIKKSIPENNNKFFDEIFNYLIETGNIGMAIDTTNIANVSLKPLKTFLNYVFIVPLKARTGILGIGLIFHDNDIDELEQFLYEFIGLFANLFGTTIENFKIKKELEVSNSLLEQKVAMRTLDLAQSRRELKAIFDTVLTGIIIFDMSREKIVRVNPMAVKIISTDSSKIIGKHIFDFLKTIDYNKIDEKSNDDFYESKLRKANNEELTILRNTTKIYLNNRIIISESFVDITKIKEAENALNNTNQYLEHKVNQRTKELEILIHKLKDEIDERQLAEEKIRKLYEEQKELNDLKTRFVRMVSHEFRTPLTLIKSSAQIITKFTDGLSETDKTHYLNRITFSVDSLTDLIDNVIFIGKNEHEKYELYFNIFNLNELLDEIKIFFEANTLDKINFEIITSPEDIEVYSDRRLLNIILNNIISNAIKYSYSNPKIIIKTELIYDNLKIDIQDFGIGIPDDEINKIFDLFYRANNVNNIRGTGLGLLVVRESIEKLKGRIEIKSVLNKGSTFTIYLPIRS